MRSRELQTILARVNAAINARAAELLSNDLESRELLGRRKMLTELLAENENASTKGAQSGQVQEA